MEDFVAAVKIPKLMKATVQTPKMIEVIRELISTSRLLTMKEEFEINRETIMQNHNGRSRKMEDLLYVCSVLCDR
jgi:hypothetical protein